jgi:hypothetical protein
MGLLVGNGRLRMVRNGKKTVDNKHGRAWLLLAFLVVVCGLLGSAQPTLAEPSCHVQYDHGKLTVLAEDVPLGNLVLPQHYLQGKKAHRPSKTNQALPGILKLKEH